MGRLHAVAASHPYLFNRLADPWDVPEGVERYLEDLLLTGRADRRGFPPAVVTEAAEPCEKNGSRLRALGKDVGAEAVLR